MRQLVLIVAVFGLAACSSPATSESSALQSTPTDSTTGQPTAPASPSAEVRHFAAAGRELSMEGATCAVQPGGYGLCQGDIAISVGEVPSLPPIELREVLLAREFPLHVGEGELEKPGATPSFVLVDYDRDGAEDLAVAVDRLGGYGQWSYSIYLQRDDRWVFSPDFSALTEGRMGTPRREGEFWVAFGKSGCCQHWEERYDVVGGKPVLRDVTITRVSADGSAATEVLRGDEAAAHVRGER
jgi:hypothetical protein